MAFDELTEEEIDQALKAYAGAPEQTAEGYLMDLMSVAPALMGMPVAPIRARLPLKGYSSHGQWSSSRRIYELEAARGNPVDKVLLKEGQEGIWITREAKEAVRYNRPASKWDLKEYPVTKEEIKAVQGVDLTKAKRIKGMTDPDGGELWVRSKGEL